MKTHPLENLTRVTIKNGIISHIDGQTVLAIDPSVDISNASDFLSKIPANHEDGVYNLTKVEMITPPPQVIRVELGVVVSDTVGQMVGMKINLESGLYQVTDKGNFNMIGD